LQYAGIAPDPEQTIFQHPSRDSKMVVVSPGCAAKPNRPKQIGQPDGVDGDRPWPLSKSTLPWGRQARILTEAGSGIRRPDKPENPLAQITP
jgi:hypothetical protein